MHFYLLSFDMISCKKKKKKSHFIFGAAFFLNGSDIHGALYVTKHISQKTYGPTWGGGDTAAKAILDADDTVRLESKLRNDVA